MRPTPTIAGACLLLCACGEPTPEVAKGAAERRAQAELTNDGCVACHADEGREWADSLHRAAYTNEAFSASYAREPLDFCLDCHSPETAPHQGPPEGAAAEDGVGCVSCHLEKGTSAVRAGPRARSGVAAPHALARTEAFAGSEACASCHEFEFPKSIRHPAGSLMQLTITEHRESEHADLSCADCHMKVAGKGASRHRRHDFVSSRDPAFMRAALDVRVKRRGEDLVFDLDPVLVGHAYPTGDLFRRLELRVDTLETGVWATKRRTFLARHFRPTSPGTSHVQEPEPPEPDDRIRGQTSIEIDLGPAANAELRWSVRYQRVDDRDARHPEKSTLAGEIVLAEGVLPGVGRDADRNED